jgi:tetratricopeptide (TPR) repeat protein
VNAAARWKKPLGVALGVALAVAVVGVALKKTGHQHRTAQGEAAEAVAKPAVAPMVDVDAAIATVVDAATVATSVSAVPAATPRPAAAKHIGASGAAAPVMDERTADPKVARALPTEFPQLLAACRQAFTEKRAKDAEIACIAAKDANPDSPDACALLGHALFNRKKRREALQWAERAVALDPKHADAYVIIGGVKQAADDVPAAKAAYQKYLELAPNGQYAADLRAIVDSL